MPLSASVECLAAAAGARGRDARQLVELARRLGAEGLGLTVDGARATGEGIPPLPATLDAAVRGGMPVTLVLHRGRARVAAEERDEREEALRRAREALALAAEWNVPLGLSLGSLARIDEEPLWRAFSRSDEEELAEVAARLGRHRDHAAPRALDSALVVLDRLLEEAGRRGLSVLLGGRGSLAGLPSPEELGRIRGELAGAPLGYLHDSPAAYRTVRLGLDPPGAWRPHLERAGAILGVDACGPRDGLAPGVGEIGYPSLLATAPREATPLLAATDATLPELERAARLLAAPRT